MPEADKDVRRLEAVVDQDWSDLEIFSLDFHQAVLLACQTFELNAIQYDALRMMIPDDTVKRQLGEQILDLLQGLDVLIRWLARKCPRGQASARVVEDAQAIQMGQVAFDKALTHVAVEQMFMAINPRIFVAAVTSDASGQECVEFRYTNDTVAYFEIANNLILSEYNAFKAKKKNKAQEYTKKMFGTQRDLMIFNQSVLTVELDFDLPDEVRVGNYTIGQIKEVWYKVLREAWHADYRNREELLENNPDFPATFPMPNVAGLNEGTWTFSVVDKATTLGLLDDLTFTGKKKGKQKYTSFLTEPILELADGTKYVSPRAIIYGLFSRNIINALNRVYPDLANLDTDQKELLFAKEIDGIARRYSNLVVGKPVQLPGDLPDVDYSLYDTTTGVLVCFELKWITEPATGAEIVSKDEDIGKGLNNQLPRYRKGILANPSDFMKKAFAHELPVQALECLVVTRISVGSGLIQDQGQHGVINIRMLKKALHDADGDLQVAIDRLKAGHYFPKEGVHFERATSELVVRGVRLIADGYKVLEPFDLSTPDDDPLIIRGKEYNPENVPELEHIQTSPTTLVIKRKDPYRRESMSRVGENRAERRRREKELRSSGKPAKAPKPHKKRKKK